MKKSPVLAHLNKDNDPQYSDINLIFDLWKMFIGVIFKKQNRFEILKLQFEETDTASSATFETRIRVVFYWNLNLQLTDNNRERSIELKRSDLGSR